MMNICKIGLSLPLLLAAIPSLNADELVNWDGRGGGVVTAHQSMTPTNVFSTAAFTSPTVGLDYGNVTSPNFYAAINSTAGMNLGNGFRIWDGTNGNDLLNRLQNNNAAGAGSKQLLSVWDAVNDGKALSSFVLQDYGQFGDMTSVAARFVFQDTSDNWYVSDSIALVTNNESVELVDASAAFWYQFTPMNGGDATIGAITVVDLNDYKRVGYMMTWDSDGTGGVYSTGFMANSVPEPSTYALLAGMLVLGFATLKRRQ